MRKNAGLNLIRSGSRNQRCFSFGSEGKRITGERRAVNATEFQRFVCLDAITLGAAFHSGIRRLVQRKLFSSAGKALQLGGPTEDYPRARSV